MNVAQTNNSMANRYTYAAFISYRHQEKEIEIAKALHRHLETFTIPKTLRKSAQKKHIGRLFRDQDELPLSSDLGSDIRAALDASEWLIVICSPAY